MTTNISKYDPIQPSHAFLPPPFARKLPKTGHPDIILVFSVVVIRLVTTPFLFSRSKQSKEMTR